MRAKPIRALLGALGVTAVIAGIGVSAAPAFAADTGFVDTFLNDVVVATQGGPGKVYAINTFEAGDVTNVKVTVDLSAIAGIATASFPDPSSSCSMSGSTATCVLPDSASTNSDGTLGLIPLKLVPDAGAVDGAHASITTTISGDGAPTQTYHVPVTVADGPDLVIANQISQKNVKPGDSSAMSFSLSNFGSETANGLLFAFDFTHGFVPDAFDNCQYEEDTFVGGTVVVCLFDSESLPVNASVNVDFTGKIAPDAATFEVGFAIADTGAAADVTSFAGGKSFAGSRGLKHRAHSGKKLSLQSAATKSMTAADIDESDNGAITEWNVATNHDVAALSAQLQGSVGDTVPASLGLKNNGPASVNVFNSEGTLATVVITVPEWAEVTKAPGDCEGLDSASQEGSSHVGKPGYKFYLCTDDSDAFLEVGATVTFPFKLKIKASHGTDGTVAIKSHTSVTEGDSNAANNTAKITLDASDQPSLPITGAKAGLIGGAGAVLLLLGVLLVVGARRRKASAV